MVLRLLAGLKTLAHASDELKQPALAMARDAAARARQAMTAESDLKTLEDAAAFAHEQGGE